MIVLVIIIVIVYEKSNVFNQICIFDVLEIFYSFMLIWKLLLLVLIVFLF